MDDTDTLHRRARLRELISHRFEGRDAALLDHIEGRISKRPNQGEMSGLQKDHGPRSFGAKKADTLEKQIGLPKLWFSMPLGSYLDVAFSNEPNRPASLEISIHSQEQGSTLSHQQVRIRGYVPLISSVQAGSWTEIAEVMEINDAEDWLPCPVKHGRNTFCLRVEGESMKNPGFKPSYDPGDIIFVDPDRCAQPGDRVVVKLDDQLQATFKQYVEEDGRKLLKALNPDWRPRYIDINGNASICGVVIGKWVPE